MFEEIVCYFTHARVLTAVFAARKKRALEREPSVEFLAFEFEELGAVDSQTSEDFHSRCFISIPRLFAAFRSSSRLPSAADTV